jgi:hypothetical protein
VKTTLYVLGGLGLFAIGFAACSSAQSDGVVKYDDDMVYHPPASANPSADPSATAAPTTPPANHPTPES